jgi:hypothetical protein
MKKLGKFFGLTLVWLLPVFAFAQITGGPTAFTVLSRIQQILNLVIPILITLGVIYFIWGVIKYVTAKDEDAQKEARSTMIYGIIGLFVIVSIWGLVDLLGRTFGLQSGGQGPGALPCIPGTIGCK